MNRRRVTRPAPATPTVDPAHARRLVALRERLAKERAALARWMGRFKRAFHAVDESEHLDPTLEEAEKRPRVTLVHSELAGNERDVRHHPRKPVALGRLQVREQRADKPATANSAT